MEYKGIYKNNKNSNVYYVNRTTNNYINASTVLVNDLGGMYRVLDCTKLILKEVFVNFTYLGDYTKELINKR